jgi:cytochrome c oxidase subunit 4
MTDAPTTQPADGHASLAHVMPVPVLLAVFALLMILTVATVSVTWIDLGGANLWIAMGIATVKAAFVALYFMHLRYDHPFNALIFIAGLLFLALFISLTMLDTLQYQPSVDPWTESGPG